MELANPNNLRFIQLWAGMPRDVERACIDEMDLIDLILFDIVPSTLQYFVETLVL
jgi:hypothetical protein